MRSLVALPVFNEASSVDQVLDEVVRYSDEVLVVDDGSSDGTAELLRRRTDVRIVTHEHNQGYGAALQTAEAFVTLDITQTHVQDGTACGPGEGPERGQQSSDTRAAIAQRPRRAR